MQSRFALRMGPALAALVALLGSCSTGPNSGPAQPISLFNGRDLQGWTAVTGDPAVRGDAVWTLRDGILVCRGEPIGYLQTDRNFTNFRMEAEYRWAPGTPPGNSGLFSRLDGDPRPLPRCVEVQLMHGNAGDVLGLQGRRIAPDQPRHFHVAAHPLAGDIDGVRKTTDAEAPPGSWNRVEILAEGPNYTVWINGVEVNRVTGVEVLSGPVALQSEGGEIHFRHLHITPLP
ncbi:MAG: DUF1080 domain-containing protein [Verrucomicrobiae bacterium]|nr:DUF1080 domain-containing protein [Verrucomicrobiae bacterium]